jgi:transcriptional regulator GlxA family with amidase domain
MAIPVIGLFVYPNINPFHFSIPYIIFNIKIEDKRLFDLKIFSIDGQPVKTEQSMMIIPDGGSNLLKNRILLLFLDGMILITSLNKYLSMP